MVLDIAFKRRNDEEEEEEEEYMIRPTRELERFIELFDKEISELSKLQISGVFYMSPRVKWFFDTAILILKSWSFFSKRYKWLLKSGDAKKREEFFKKVFSETQAITGLDKNYQVKVVVKVLAFIEEVYRVSYSTLQVLWTGLYWFMTQGRVELRYVLQPYLGAKTPLILPTFGEGEKSE